MDAGSFRKLPCHRHLWRQAYEINAELDTYLREKFDQYGIIIDTVNFTDISVDDETAAAIQKKVTAQQELELANIEKANRQGSG